MIEQLRLCGARIVRAVRQWHPEYVPVIALRLRPRVVGRRGAWSVRACTARAGASLAGVSLVAASLAAPGYAHGGPPHHEEASSLPALVEIQVGQRTLGWISPHLFGANLLWPYNAGVPSTRKPIVSTLGSWRRSGGWASRPCATRPASPPTASTGCTPSGRRGNAYPTSPTACRAQSFRKSAARWTGLHLPPSGPDKFGEPA